MYDEILKLSICYCALRSSELEILPPSNQFSLSTALCWGSTATKRRARPIATLSVEQESLPRKMSIWLLFVCLVASAGAAPSSRSLENLDSFEEEEHASEEAKVAAVSDSFQRKRDNEYRRPDSNSEGSNSNVFP